MNSIRKYNLNEDYFNNLKTHEQAYILGFIYADGYNREDKLELVQKEERIDILENINKALNSNALIKSYSPGVYRLDINSKKLCSDLIKLGAVRNKSLTLTFPNFIPEELMSSFILGYFDGDGSICKLKQYNNYEWSIQGTKEMLNWINSVLQLDCKLKQRNPNSNLNNYYISIGGTNKIYNILYKLYNSCSIHLERKYLIYKELETVVLKRNFK